MVKEMNNRENPLSDLRVDPVFEFENGEYLYIGYENGYLYAGGATNTGIFHEFEMKYDWDFSVDKNLQDFYDYIIEKDPERFFLPENYGKRSKTAIRKKYMKEDTNASIDQGKVTQFIKESVKALLNNEATNCRLILDGSLAIFVGWSNGFDENDPDVFHPTDEKDSSWGMVVGIKVWTSDDLWTDYDWLNFPYSHDGVYDVEETLGPHDDYATIARWLLQSYKELWKDLEGYYIEDDGEIVKNDDVEDESYKGYRNRRKIFREVDMRDDIDAERDDRDERAKRRYMRMKDDADSDRDYRLNHHITRRNESRNRSFLKLKEAPIYDLTPEYDTRGSFYSKAKVVTGDNGDQNKLYSYNTLVAELVNGKPVVYNLQSSTTLRHVREWLKQLGFPAETKSQIWRDYGAEKA